MLEDSHHSPGLWMKELQYDSLSYGSVPQLAMHHLLI